MRVKFLYLTGDASYLLWYIYNDFQPDLEIIMTLEQNLEIFITEDGGLLAYRYDHPADIRHMVKNDGIWQFTDEGMALGEQEFLRLKCSMSIRSN